MNDMDPRIRRVENENQAWLVGQLFGAMMRIAAAEAVNHPEQLDHTRVELIDFPDGAHAATFRVFRPSGSYLVSVEIEEQEVPDE
jgi:hypothetical protein